MGFFIVQNRKGEFLTNRRATGRMYKSRSTWSADTDDAKVFSTKGAATNSAKQSGETNFNVLRVSLDIAKDQS